MENRSGIELPVEHFEQLAMYVLEQEQAAEASEVSVSFVDKEEIRYLNRQYRGLDNTTDILSFWYDDDDSDLLGDVIICPQVAHQYSYVDGEEALSDVVNLDLLLIHGLLHLLGYDHHEDGQAEAMEDRENQLLALWNASHPA
jgi:probable rRNA maturation factor